MEKMETAPAMSAEQAQDRAALLAAVAGEAPPPGSPEAEPQPPAVDLAAELSGLLLTVSAVLKPALPSLATIYTEETCGAAGAAIAGVCNKHGWLQDGVMQGYGEEVTALMVCGPMAVATVVGVRADLAAKRKEASQDNLGALVAAPGNTPGDDLTPSTMLQRG